MKSKQKSIWTCPVCGAAAYRSRGGYDICSECGHKLTLSEKLSSLPLIGKLFGRTRRPIPQPQKQEKSRSDLQTGTPTSRKVPIIPLNQILEVLLVYELNTSDESERRWLSSIAPSVLKHNWPDIVNSCVRRKPGVPVTVQFHSSASATNEINNRATELNANVVIQPKTNLLGDDDHRRKEYGITLAIFMSRPSGSASPVIALVAGNHRLQCTA